MMKFLQVILLLLLVPLLVVESSYSADDNFMSKITRDSSLSSNDTSPYWLSPSGNIAFGFYQLPCARSTPNCNDRYVVGIWFVKSPLQTLVWTANPNDLLLDKPSSILFTKEGKLILRILPDHIDKRLLPNVPEPASYAMMHDDGNLVLYGSDSQVVWQSFDYPTDTILGGQSLKGGIDLMSGNHKLTVRRTDGLVVISSIDVITHPLRRYQTGDQTLTVVSEEVEGSVSSPVTLKLDTSGNLYLADSDDVVLQYLYRNKNQQQDEEGIIAKEEGVHIYRATLDSEGNFNLYKERIDTYALRSDYSEKASSFLVQVWQSDHANHDFEVLFGILFIICMAAVIVKESGAKINLGIQEPRKASRAEYL